MTNTTPDRADIRQRIEQLATLSKELEIAAKLQANAPNIVAAEQFKRKVVELTESQGRMMRDLVAMHPDPQAQELYASLQKQIEEAQLKVRSTRSMDELKQLETALDKLVSSYVHHFQTVVAELMGAPPPSGPVFS